MAQRLYLPIEQVFSDLGAIGAGYKLYTYKTGTSTPKATYSDTALSSANTNPIIADSAGRLGDIFVDDLSTYKLVLTDADDVTIWSKDPVDPKTFSLADFDPRPTSFWGTTAGTSTAYTLDADPDVSAYSSTQTFYFACHTDCGDNPTMAVDGLTALNLKKYDNQGSKVSLESLDMESGQTYEARIDGTDIVILNPNITEYSKNNKLNLNPNTVTISSGVIPYSGAYMVVDAEGGASIDDLNTISGGREGDVAIINTANGTRDVVINHAAGNIRTVQDRDITLSDTNDTITFIFDGSNWYEISRSIKNDFLASKTTNGYTYLPNGIIFQWMTVSCTLDTDEAFSFPITFPNNVFPGFTNSASLAATNDYKITGLTTSQITLDRADTINGSNNVYVFAIGN